MNENNHSKDLFLVGMIASMTCWGFSWTAGKILSSYGDPITISFLRFVLTVLSLPFMLLFFRQSISIKKAGLRDLLIASALMSFYTYSFFKGLVTGKAGAGGVLVTVLNPIFSYAIMLVVSRRTPTRNETLGLVLGLIAGTVLLKLFTDADKLFSAGNIYFLMASCSWALLSVFTARAPRYGSSIAFSFWMYSACVVILVFGSSMSQVSAVIEAADWRFWFNLFFSATITTSLATTFYFIATSKLGASKASSFIFMVPFSAAIGSWIFLGEVPQWHTIVGGILGIAAVYVLNKKDSVK